MIATGKRVKTAKKLVKRDFTAARRSSEEGFVLDHEDPEIVAVRHDDGTIGWYLESELMVVS